MSKAQRGLLYLIGILGFGGVIFNVFQGIIILAGGYNRNPNIESPILQALDSVALTGLWLLVSVLMLLASIDGLRHQK